MEKEIEFGEVSRYLAGFAILLSLLTYLGITYSTSVLTLADNSVGWFIYYLGFFALILAVMGYIIDDVETAKQLFSISIILTAISMFFYSPTTDSGMYYGGVVMFLLFGILLFLYFTKYEKSEEVVMKNVFLFITSIIYLISVVLIAMFGGLSAEDLTTYKFWLIGDMFPQSLLLGGTFSAVFMVLLLIYAIFGLVAVSEFTEKIKDILRVLLPFVWILGFLYSMYVKVFVYYGSITSGSMISNNLVGVFALMFSVTNIMSIFYAILIIFLVIHVVTNYAVIKE